MECTRRASTVKPDSVDFTRVPTTALVDARRRLIAERSAATATVKLTHSKRLGYLSPNKGNFRLPVREEAVSALLSWWC